MATLTKYTLLFDQVISNDYLLINNKKKKIPSIYYILKIYNMFNQYNIC